MLFSICNKTGLYDSVYFIEFDEWIRIFQSQYKQILDKKAPIKLPNLFDKTKFLEMIKSYTQILVKFSTRLRLFKSIFSNNRQD